MAHFPFYHPHPAFAAAALGRCQLQPEDQSAGDRAREATRLLQPRPASGRTTAQGRKVERPGTGKQAGPSGQKDQGQESRKHANK